MKGVPKIDEESAVETLSPADFEAWKTALIANYQSTIEAGRTNGFQISSNDRIELEVMRDALLNAGEIINTYAPALKERNNDADKAKLTKFRKQYIYCFRGWKLMRARITYGSKAAVVLYGKEISLLLSIFHRKFFD